MGQLDSLRSTAELGRAGEAAAARHLEGLGYRILVRNYRKGPGEVDLIAEATQASPPPALAGELVFCEVKTRAYRRDAEPMLEAVPRAKRRKIALTALAFCQERKIEAFMRFDVIAVSATGRAGDGVKVVLHLPHAFTTDDLGIHG